jgi:hypothetical protein
MMRTRLLLFVASLALLLGPEQATCRSALYNTTHARLEGKLNVHIISHTHNDPGWLSSYAQYHRTLDLDGHTIGEAPHQQWNTLLLTLVLECR